MKEIHSGICESHIGARALLGKVFFQGFYWLKATLDVVDLVQKCDNCQRCAKYKKQPASFAQLIQPTWPLQRWGMNIIGSILPAQGNLKYVLVAVEYFYKWIEAKVLATMTSATIQIFYWQNIICHLGIPKSITTDNGTQFDSKAFMSFCSQVSTNLHFASVRHPESNGLVERTNGIILLGITKSLV
jgi:hypothetical protein